jgi:LmbE family N-acetylglucosaminyl deacetylase
MKLIRVVSMLTVLGAAGLANACAVSADDTAKPSKVLLGVFAHPDDETICAGLLARAAATGWEVRVIFATSGDAGSDVSGRNLKGAELGKEREREVANALAALGVKLPPTFLGFSDGAVAQSRLLVKERLVEELGRLKPDVIVTFGPDGFTGHADHIAVGKATDEAAKEITAACAVYHAVLGKQLEGWAAVAGVAVPKGAKLPENLVTVDVKQFQAQRLASLDCHKTQWTPEIQEKLRDFRRAYPFEEFVWSGGGLGVPGKWVGP